MFIYAPSDPSRSYPTLFDPMRCYPRPRDRHAGLCHGIYRRNIEGRSNEAVRTSRPETEGNPVIGERASNRERGARDHREECGASPRQRTKTRVERVDGASSEEEPAPSPRFLSYRNSRIRPELGSAGDRLLSRPTAKTERFSRRIKPGGTRTSTADAQMKYSRHLRAPRVSNLFRKKK